MAIYSQIVKEFHTPKESFFGPLVTVSTGFHCSLRMCCMVKFKQSFVKHRDIHFRHFLPVRKNLFVGYPCVVLVSFFLQRVGKIIFQWRPRSLCCSVNTCRCVFAKFFQMGRIPNYQQVRQVWKLGARHYYSRDFSIMATSSASAIPSSRRGRVPWHLLRLPLWLSQPFYIVMLNMGRDI